MPPTDRVQQASRATDCCVGHSDRQLEKRHGYRCRGHHHSPAPTRLRREARWRSSRPVARSAPRRCIPGHAQQREPRETETETATAQAHADHFDALFRLIPPALTDRAVRHRCPSHARHSPLPLLAHTVLSYGRPCGKARSSRPPARLFAWLRCDRRVGHPHLLEPIHAPAGVPKPRRGRTRAVETVASAGGARSSVVFCGASRPLMVACCMLHVAQAERAVAEARSAQQWQTMLRSMQRAHALRRAMVQSIDSPSWMAEQASA